MTYKGKQFTRADAERLLGKGRVQLLRRGKDAEAKLDAEAKALTERFRIVARDAGRPVIAEELTERILRRLGENARPVATYLMMQPAAVRVAVLAAFDAKTGELINTLDPA